MSSNPSDESTDKPLSALGGTCVSGAVGHVVIESGLGSSGADAIGIWHLAPTGQPVGAWITTLDSLQEDEAAAQEALELLRCRSLLCWDHGAASAIVDRVATLAGISPPSGWDAAAVRLPEALVEIAEHRARHAQAVRDHCTASRNRRNKATPLSWRREVPTDLATLQQLQRVARVVGTVGANQVAQRSLLLSRLTRWVVELWHDTEQVRARRQYLREQFGPLAPLPPRWLGQLRAAHATMGR